MGDWVDFFVAEVGAAAALAGLLFVAISINVAKIVSYPTLPGRAAHTLIMISAALVVASLALLPGQPHTAFGAEALIIGVFLALAGLRQGWQANRHRRPGDPLLWLVLPVTLELLVSLPFMIGGALLIAGIDGALYWIAAGIVLSFIVTLQNGWVLLIEILR